MNIYVKYKNFQPLQFSFYGRGVVCESDRSVKVTNIGKVKEIRYLLGKNTYFSFQLCLVV